MQKQQKRIVLIATKEELTNEQYYRRLWLATRNVKISRRSWLDEIADTFRDFDGVLIYRSGIPFAIPDVDAVMGDDPDLRWLGYFMASDDSGRYPKIRTHKHLRLQLLDAYFRIKHPEIARHFGV